MAHAVGNRAWGQAGPDCGITPMNSSIQPVRKPLGTSRSCSTIQISRALSSMHAVIAAFITMLEAYHSQLWGWTYDAGWDRVGDQG